MTDDTRAVDLYRLALSVVEQKGRFVTIGLVTYPTFGLLRRRAHMLSPSSNSN